MTRRIFRSILLVASIVLLASLAIIMEVLYEYFSSIQSSRLRTQLALAAQSVENEGMAYFDGLAAHDYRFTWINTDGTVLYDSEIVSGETENHADREEIREALENGVGESARYSATLAEKTLYLAQRLSDGTVLRISVTQYTMLTLVLGTLQPTLIVFVVAIILSFLLARRMSRRIVEPLNTLDLDRPLENDTYEELSPLLTRIEQQHRQIESQLNELKRRHNEFTTISNSLNEGLVLLDENGVVLSINPAAMQLFGADDNCIGQDFLVIDRSRDVHNAIHAALSDGHGKALISRNGGEYQLDASRIGSEAHATGVVLLAFDITERAFAERNRQEFTANVSHELKTPLQSIMGSAELIENGLVKAGDMPRFIGHIRSEAARLVTLIDDIIGLSQLDEGVDLPREEVDLYELAKETAASLAPAAAAKNVRLTVDGRRTMIHGVRRLLQEIVFNLCDNAVKYNVENGSVTITVARSGKTAVLTVEDTGIGIPPAHQSRVFERFYRVDKSHSKETGGTGLGLSIVKHAAQCHNADIDLRSEVGKGTSVSITFPC